MRYLKTYEGYEEPSDIEQTLTEICYDITDDKFKIEVDRGYLWIVLDEHNETSPETHFDYQEVEETVSRVKKYLGDKYVSTSVQIVEDHKIVPWKDIDSTWWRLTKQQLSKCKRILVWWSNDGDTSTLRY